MGFIKSGFINGFLLISGRENPHTLADMVLTGDLVHPTTVELTGRYWLLRRDLNPPSPTPGEHPCFTPTSK
tara:strand:- start:5336 stop:5548 length:213 start_codon:yes stop_codon:yes gene_type:complete